MEKENIEEMEKMPFGESNKIQTKKYFNKNIIKIILCALFIIYFILKFDYKELILMDGQYSTQIECSGSHCLIKKEVFDNFKYYINICQKGILLNKNISNSILQPKITAIIPIYKGGKYLYYSLRSIQNQKMKEIEIILIDDCSPDDSVEIIEEYMKEDPRIRLIKNKKNRNILYSKSLGALNAKGKYILELDQDDMFISDYAFETLYNLAEKKDLDLLQFRDFAWIQFKLKKKWRNLRNGEGMIPPQDIRKDNYFIQPELKFKFFCFGYNFLLWGLLIKAEIYKKAVINFWPMIINYKLALLEDYEMTFFLLIYAKNYQYVNYFYLFHYYHPQSVTSNYITQKEYIQSILFVGNNIFEYYINNNPQDIKMATNFFVCYKDILKEIKQKYSGFTDLFVKKVLDNNYLTYEEKKEMLKSSNLLEDYKIFNTYEYFMNSEEYNSILQYQNLINGRTNKNIKNNFLNPRFSIIIYCNQYNYLEKTINSIENQKYDNYDITLIYDNNNVTELESIELLIKNYNNIKLINNMEEKGLLYSYTKCILESKGEYILTIQPGYTLATQNVLEELNNNIDDNIDILEFNLLINSQENIRNNSLDLYKCLHFKTNITVDKIIFNKYAMPLDLKKELIKNKLIKSNIYKSIINEYKSIFDNKIIYNYYDDIIIFLINKKGIKIKHIDNFGIIQYKNTIKYLDKDISIKHNDQLIQDIIFYFNFIFDYSNNTIEDIKPIIYELYNHLNIICYKNSNYFEEVKQLINKFLNSKKISENKKDNLLFYYNSLMT